MYKLSAEYSCDDDSLTVCGENVNIRRKMALTFYLEDGPGWSPVKEKWLTWACMREQLRPRIKCQYLPQGGSDGWLSPVSILPEGWSGLAASDGEAANIRSKMALMVDFLPGGWSGWPLAASEGEVANIRTPQDGSDGWLSTWRMARAGRQWRRSGWPGPACWSSSSQGEPAAAGWSTQAAFHHKK